MNILSYIISALTLLLLDSIYISLIGDFFKSMVNEIQKSKFIFNYIGAFGSYLFLIILINKFIISQNKGMLDAFILGSAIYAVFDFTNMAIFKNYSMFLGFIDIIWGGLLFSLTTLITYIFVNRRIV